MNSLVFQLASLTDVHWTMSGDVLLMTLLGGLGTVFGPVVGAFIVIAMQNYLAPFGQWVLVIQGAIFVVCVLAVPAGHRRRTGAASARAALSMSGGTLFSESCSAEKSERQSIQSGNDCALRHIFPQTYQQNQFTHDRGMHRTTALICAFWLRSREFQVSFSTR